MEITSDFPLDLTRCVSLNEAAELHIIDRTAVIFREIDQQFFALDHLATFIWCCCEEAHTSATILTLLSRTYGMTECAAEQCLRETIMQWHGLGLILGSGLRPIHANVPLDNKVDLEGNTVDLDRPLEINLAHVPYEYAYKLLDNIFSIRYESEEQVATVHRVFEHLQIAAPDSGTTAITLVRFDNQFRLFLGSFEFARCEDEAQLAPLIKSIFLDRAVDSLGSCLAFHAGAIANTSGCVLLPGCSGSGKTTLTAGLLSIGLDYISDELVLLDEQLCARGAPISLCVKKGAWDILAVHFPEILELPIHRRPFDDKQVRYLRPPETQLSYSPSPVKAIVFPRYDKDGDTKLVSIDKDRGIKLLLKQRFTRKHKESQKTIHRLFCLIKNTEFFELSVSSLNVAIKELRGLVGR